MGVSFRNEGITEEPNRAAVSKRHRERSIRTEPAGVLVKKLFRFIERAPHSAYGRRAQRRT